MTQAQQETGWTESELLEGCRRGRRAAQQALYERTSERIYRLLLKLTRNEQDAADLLQDTYIRVFEHIDGFQGGSNLATWIYRIAINEARQAFRRRQRQGEILRHEVPPPSEAVPGEAGAIDLKLDVWAAVQRLPVEERALIVLRYFEDMDYAQMAEVLEKPLGTISSGLNRARRMLEQLLSHDAHP